MLYSQVSRSLQTLGRSTAGCIAQKTSSFPAPCIVSSKLLHSSAKMASTDQLQRIKARSEQTDRILAQLQGQVEAIKKAALREAGRGEEDKLFKENEELKKEVSALKQALTISEIANGVRQVKIPTKASLAATMATAIANISPVVNGLSASEPEKQQAKPQAGKPEGSGKKTKQEAPTEGGAKKAKTDKGGKGGKAGGDEGKAQKSTAAGAGGDNPDAPLDVSRLDLRIGKIVGVEKHPDADALYVEQVDLGEGKLRTIVSGLVKHVPLNAMQGRIAVFFCNLKPAKMRGVLSEGMIMCATNSEKVEILVPPVDAVIGDRVSAAEYPGSPDGQLNPKKKIWETLKPDMRTNTDRVATFKGAPLIIQGKGQVVAPSLSDAQIS